MTSDTRSIALTNALRPHPHLLDVSGRRLLNAVILAWTAMCHHAERADRRVPYC